LCKPRSLYERGLGVKNAQKAGENRRKACEAKEGKSCFNLGDNAMLSKKTSLAQKLSAKGLHLRPGDGEAAKAIEKSQSSMINSDHRKFIV